ncbi:MAG: quinolinate synthase NadA [Bacteroides sp.]|nr:quinolinate synthase NadA [Bacteroides sp.]
MNIREVQEKILKLKKEKDFCILAHSYVKKEILEIADITGDSFKLSRNVCDTEAENILFCGVHFMAETAKMLNPDKKVYLANGGAGCPMAEQFTPADIAELKRKYPLHSVVAYINTTAALKEHCDVCVTSASAVEIVRKMDSDKILFIPDPNLGAFVKDSLPQKDVKLVQGGCPIHAAVTVEEAEEAKRLYPNALLLVHPECVPAVAALADYIGSTSGIIAFAKKSDHKEFIIGTELEIAETLQYECPDKTFNLLSKKLICPDMKLTTLFDVLNVLERPESACEIIMSKEQAEKSRKCIDEMLRLGE